MSILSIQDVLQRALPQKGWQQKLLREWPAIIGGLDSHMRVEKIQGSCLILGVYDTHWMHELFMLQQHILETIATALGEDHITELRFVPVTKTKENINKKQPEDARLKSRLASTLSPHHEQVLTRIKDESLQQALRHFFTNCVHP